MKVHSKVDLITNSSTELFVVYKEHGAERATIEFVEKLAEFFKVPNTVRVEKKLRENFIGEVVDACKEEPRYNYYWESRGYSSAEEWAENDPQDAFYELAYYEGVKDPYEIILYNTETLRSLNLECVKSFLEGVESGNG